MVFAMKSLALKLLTNIVLWLDQVKSYVFQSISLVFKLFNGQMNNAIITRFESPAFNALPTSKTVMFTRMFLINKDL
jgi:hypothetical protein